ncbi:hypothetical protein LIA77_04575 [Sarocladium implicatum]|nr:hypothetical protein LIA77_04575 [Sarocladium implicatum]
MAKVVSQTVGARTINTGIIESKSTSMTAPREITKGENKASKFGKTNWILFHLRPGSMLDVIVKCRHGDDLVAVFKATLYRHHQPLPSCSACLPLASPSADLITPHPCRHPVHGPQHATSSSQV